MKGISCLTVQQQASFLVNVGERQIALCEHKQFNCARGTTQHILQIVMMMFTLHSDALLALVYAAPATNRAAA
jgi:hypothetical protein